MLGGVVLADNSQQHPTQTDIVGCQGYPTAINRHEIKDGIVIRLFLLFAKHAFYSLFCVGCQATLTSSK